MLTKKLDKLGEMIRRKERIGRTFDYRKVLSEKEFKEFKKRFLNKSPENQLPMSKYKDYGTMRSIGSSTSSIGEFSKNYVGGEEMYEIILPVDSFGYSVERLEKRKEIIDIIDGIKRIQT